MAFRYRIDVSRCIGCRACEVACVTANLLEPERSRNWVPYLEESAEQRSHAVFAPYLCHHCEEPPCVPVCPTGASYQAEDGRVLVDRDLCIGCGLCVPACPYEARYVEPTVSKLEKCTLCDGRVQAGRAPACFEVCPAGARTFVETLGRREVRVGDPDALDAGHEAIRMTTEEVDPRPRLVVSGRPEDLALVRERRRPHGVTAMPSTLWRGGIGLAVQALGGAAVLAMLGMVGLRLIRGRGRPAAAAPAPARGSTSGETQKKEGDDDEEARS